jgi:hypothetical protein
VKNIRIVFGMGALALMLGSQIGCNVFDPIDSPSGDEQVLSAARACLDNGEYQCALDNYAKLSSAQDATRYTEEAFAILDQNGAGFGAFAGAFGKDFGTPGKGLTKLANGMVNGAGEARRVALHSAYKKNEKIVGNDNLKNLVKFLSAASLASEILAEIAGSDQVLKPSDLAGGGLNCTANGPPICAINTSGCGPGTASTFTVGSNGDINGATIAGTVNISQLFSAVKEAQAAVGALGGTSQASFTALLGNQTTLTIEAEAQCFRAGLINAGIGG